MNEIKNNKSLAWYFHPNELVRLMRFRLLDPLDPSVDLTPKYEDDISVGVVIDTDGGTGLVDLQMHYLNEVNGIKKILIHDDCSEKKGELLSVAQKYGADFFSTDKKMFSEKIIGALSTQDCIYRGLQWAKKNRLDVLVKMSKGFIPCYRWIDYFKSLVKGSNGLTFSSYCIKNKLPIRTECIGMNVNAWTCQYVMDNMKFNLENEIVLNLNFWMDSMAKQLDFQNKSAKYAEWRREHPVAQLYSGYVQWQDMLGVMRDEISNRNKNILWREYSKKEEYMIKLKEEFHNKYSLDDDDLKE